jgi:hypothetical protein
MGWEKSFGIGVKYRDGACSLGRHQGTALRHIRKVRRIGVLPKELRVGYAGSSVLCDGAIEIFVLMRA